MAEFFDKANQCQICTCKICPNCSNINENTRHVINSDDNDARSLSSLFNMFGIKYTRVTRSTTDSEGSQTSPTLKSASLRGRVAPIMSRSVSPPTPDISNLRATIYESDNSFNSIWINEPDTPSELYKHPWL